MTQADSGISFDDIERTRRGFSVPARVFLQEIDVNGHAGLQVRELKNWTSLTATSSVQGPGNASITLTNTFDRFFRNKYTRRYGQGTQATQDATATLAYLNDVLGRCGDKVNYLNPTRRESFYGTGNAAVNNAAHDYINNMRDLLANAGTKVGVDQLPGDAVDLGLLQRVFIDVPGRDGQIYAGFTGVLSSIIDSSGAGEQATVTLTCKDYWRLFQFTEYVMKEGPGFNQLDETIALDTQHDLGLENYVGNSLFDGMDGIAAIKNLVKIMQSTFCANSYIQQKLQANLGLTQLSVADKCQNLFFYQDRFFNLDDNADLTAVYDGTSPLRIVKSALVVTNPVSIRGRLFNPGDVVPAKLPGVGIEDGDLVAQMESEIYVDRAISFGPQAEVYRRVIERILQPFQAQRSRGDVILRKVAEATMYEVFFDANGNLIYQIPRRNNFPGEYNPAINNSNTASNSSTVNPAVTTTAEEDEFLSISPSGISSAPQTANYDFTQSGEWDYSPPGEGLPTKAHGFNYIITDLSKRKWDLILSEEPIVTNVRAPTGFDLINFSDVLATGFLTGITRLADVQYLQRRFGLRTAEIQKLFLPRFMSTEKQNSNHRSVDDTYALAVMANLNANASTGQLTLSFRPDLAPGKNLFLMERQRLYEIMTRSLTINVGGDATTVLQLGFGHDIGERIPNPWVSIESDVVGQLPKGSGLAVSPTGADQAPADPNATPGDQTIATNPVGGPLILPGGRASLNQNYGTIQGAENPWANGTKDFTVNSDGTVTLTNGFAAANITQISVPTGSGSAVLLINNKLKGVFMSVFGEISAAFRINPLFAGYNLIVGQSFKPRFAAYNSNYPHQLSTHTWGVAVDLYVVKVGQSRPVYHLGQILPQNKLLVPYFNKYGFVWGGNFKGVRDDIHFQFCKTDGKDVVVTEPSGLE